MDLEEGAFPWHFDPAMGFLSECVGSLKLPPPRAKKRVKSAAMEPLIAKTFAYHKPSPDGIQAIQKLREAYSNLLSEIQICCPNSREKSVAITELETSCMWATKAVVMNDDRSVIES